MRAKDVKVGEIYFQQKSRYMTPDALLVLSLDKELTVNRGWSKMATLSRRSARDPRSATHIGVRITGQILETLDAWVQGGEPPSFLQSIPDILAQFDTLVTRDLPGIPTDTTVNRSLLDSDRDLMLTRFTPRELHGTWLEKRAEQLTAEREAETRDALAKKAATLRAEVFLQTRELARDMGIEVIESRDYRFGHLSCEYTKIETSILLVLLKDAQAHRGRNVDLIAAFDADRAEQEGLHG